MQHHPLPEYPRPALRRDSYENLNGLWQYAITSSAGLPARWDGDILVPYSPETKASGVGRTLQPGAWLHYHRSFVPPAGTGGRVLLHFGAVDYACAVQVNGHLVGGHRGGYWPFALDITDALNPAGHDRLWVAVQDPTGTGVQARGKQTLRPGGINRNPVVDHRPNPHACQDIRRHLPDRGLHLFPGICGPIRGSQFLLRQLQAFSLPNELLHIPFQMQSLNQGTPRYRDQKPQQHIRSRDPAAKNTRQKHEGAQIHHG